MLDHIPDNSLAIAAKTIRDIIDDIVFREPDDRKKYTIAEAVRAWNRRLTPTGKRPNRTASE